ncbi:Tetratricopeptide repeat-containing protein [Agrococcus baldri]|uniref:Tetratricopeptide repeat-containing protein n=1 Tax=Agrococcus baldri TaxID=153730 RepID=A0AA94HKA4_9MICO|nr:DUF4062 domain-containing protein [Agrococcus baldri]SFR99473.1 Tetratricopeptide repeat-containing protein [Agrococcus baldri]
MPIELQGRQVFIASPSGLDPERDAVRQALRIFNRSDAMREGVIFIDRGWEETPPGVGRAQTLINRLIEPCDFMLVVLGERWGTPPGESKFSSGTEEEFYYALDLLAAVNSDMRDIHVYFRTIAPELLRDPGDELKKVLAFKQRLQESQKILYSTFDTDENLALRVHRSLREWSGTLSARSPMVIDMPGSFADFERASVDPLEAALEAETQGATVRAEILFAQAAEDGDPAALVASARFARRRGLLEDATEQNKHAVAALSARRDRSSDEDSALVSAMANIGVIARSQGDIERSIAALEEAIRLAESSPHDVTEQLTYALDNLGHSLAHISHLDEARAAYERAGDARRIAGDPRHALMTSLHLGWLALKNSQPEIAAANFESAAAELEDDPVEMARCLSGWGDALVQVGRADEAVEKLDRSLEINKELGNSNGISIASGLLARAYANLGDGDAEQAAIEETIRQSERSGSAIGRATGLRLQAERFARLGDQVSALRSFETAEEVANASGNAPLASAIANSRRSSLGT